MSKPVSISEQLADRHVAVRRRKRHQIYLAGGAVFAAGVVVWLVWFSGVLTVQSVRVDGQQRLTADQVRTAAEIPDGIALARLDVDVIEDNVRKLPAVSSVEVSRSWPRSVTVSVRERSPVGWLRAGSQLRGVDRSGVGFRSFKRKPARLPELQVSAVGDGRARTLQAAAAVAYQVRRHDAGWTKQVTVVEAATRDSVTLRLADGRRIVWGSDSYGTRKLEVLGSLLKLKAQQYDISAPDQPTTRD